MELDTLKRRFTYLIENATPINQWKELYKDQTQWFYINPPKEGENDLQEIPILKEILERYKLPYSIKASASGDQFPYIWTNMMFLPPITVDIADEILSKVSIVDDMLYYNNVPVNVANNLFRGYLSLISELDPNPWKASFKKTDETSAEDEGLIESEDGTWVPEGQSDNENDIW